MTAISACNDDDNNTSSSTTPDSSLDNVNPVMLEILRHANPFSTVFSTTIHSATAGPIIFTPGFKTLSPDGGGLSGYAEIGTEARFELLTGFEEMFFYNKNDLDTEFALSTTLAGVHAPITFRENGFTTHINIPANSFPAGDEYIIPSTCVLSFDFNEATGQFIMNSQESYVIYGTQTVFLTADPITAPLP